MVPAHSPYQRPKDMFSLRNTPIVWTLVINAWKTTSAGSVFRCGSEGLPFYRAYAPGAINGDQSDPAHLKVPP
ncbi:hypothetical protein CHARACLAT_021061 [Characodon lateralis]|uniref:Uncharacterized protein n=1 Tax=Characodon lateralis TaxID=208331 RepID=A0ABU7DIH4_9TELE|nr:hypothetical protein [Characodon lateralis]